VQCLNSDVFNMTDARFFTSRLWARLFREFRLALAIASCWVIYKYTQATSFGLTEFITHFSTSFFLAAWFTGQFVRVDRQQSVDENLTVIRDELQAAAEAIRKVTKLQSEILQRTSSDPVLASKIIDILHLTTEANTHLVAANSSLVVALSGDNLSTGSPTLGQPALIVRTRKD